MSLLFSPIYKCEESSELRKNPEFMGSNFHLQPQQQHHQPQPQPQQPQHHHQQQSSGLVRYRSAPSSLIESLMDGTDGGCEDFQYLRSSSPEVDAILDKFLSSCNGSGDSNSNELHEFGGKSMKQEAMDPAPEQNGYSNSSHMAYEAPQAHELQQPNLAGVVTGIKSSFPAMNSMQAEMGTRNCSNLIRQSSSPAGFFSNLNVENGFGEMREVGNYRGGNGVKGETMASTSRMNNYMNFTPSSSRPMPQTSTQHMGLSNDNKRGYMSSFLDDSWQGSGVNSLKRAREENGNMYSSFNSLETQYSLPNTSAEMAAIDKYLQFQGSVPCKIRAKRGFATHPRSIAERMRRTRISDRMKKLQDLFPDMDKQTNTADMLDLAVEYIKDLQKRVNTLTDTRDKCTCPSTKKHYSNPSA